MTRTEIISLCVILAIIHSTVQLSCGPGEVEDSCLPNSDRCYRCPTNECEYKNCSTPNVCGEPKCHCGFNMKRALNGTCINTRDCPPFKCDRVNEEYVACPPYCPSDDCKQSTPDGRCPLPGFIRVVVECVPACRCIKGHWRKNGTCVPYNQCTEHASPRRIFPGK